MRPSLVEWLKSSKYSHLLESTDGIEWLHDYDCWYSAGTVLLIRADGITPQLPDDQWRDEWEYKEVVIHATGSIIDNEIEDFGFAECYAVLEGGEVGVGLVQNQIDWG